MTLTSLHLQNFRSYKKSNFDFSSATTIIVGPNASGKTNLMEAISLLATGRSFRAEKDSETVIFEKEVGRVEGKITQLKEEKELEIVLTKGEVMGEKTPIKKYSVNGVAKGMLDFVGTLKVVLFWPQDMELVTDSPSLRRHYLNFVLMQVDREYRRTLISYEKGLRQRNRLLELIRDGKAHRHQLLFWDQLLIRNGEYITGKREEYVDFINQCQMSSASWRIKCQNLNNYQLMYDKSVISRARLDQYSEEEIAAGVTLVGSHRDDFEFRIKPCLPAGRNLELRIKDEETRNLSHYGSRGEQRLAVLWLKLGELAYIEAETYEKPVLLLDDILSELDHEHRQIIFGLLGRQQTILTTTDRHLLPRLSHQTKMVELG